MEEHTMNNQLRNSLELKVGDEVLFDDTDGKRRTAVVCEVNTVNWEGRPSVDISLYSNGCRRVLTRPAHKLQVTRRFWRLCVRLE
jgi:3-dehydroquinate synthase class II